MKKERTIDAFESTLQASHAWVNEYGAALGQDHPPLAYRCLRAALHVLRDRLPVDEAVGLAAQLPMLLRGAYYEGWRPSRAPSRIHTADELYAEVSRELEGGLGAPPRDVVRAAFAVLDAHVDAGEIEKIRHVLPEGIRRIWTHRAGPAEAQPSPR
jgi:uncharacterized protein (DUF2267 family)